MKKYLSIAVIAIVAFVAGYYVGKPTDLQVANYHTLPYKIECLEAYWDYLIASEQLFFEVEATLEEYPDVIMEQDVWYEYEEARNKVYYLNSLEK